MEMRPSLSICSMIEQSRNSQPQHHRQPLNQTSIRSFFVTKVTPSTQNHQCSYNKRPISSTSTIISNESSTKSHKSSNDLSKSSSYVPSNTSNSQEYLKNNRPVSACSNDTSIEPGAPEALHDSTKYFTNVTHKRTKVCSTKSNSTTTSSTRPKSRQQLYIDFGQRNFAATSICKICGMLFVHGVQSDIQQHEKICHNYQYGVLWNASSIYKKGSYCKSDTEHQRPRVCYEWTLPKNNHHGTVTCIQPSVNRRPSTKNNRTSDDLQLRASIVEIRPNSNGTYNNNKKLKLVRMIVDQELGFVRDVNNNTIKNEPTTYVCIVNKRVVGMVLVEEITTAYHIILQDEFSAKSMSETTKQMNAGLSRSTQPIKAVLGIHQLWVHDTYRHRGIASTLVNVARKYMYFGYSSVPMNQIAFSSPTESGLAFATQYCLSTRQPNEKSNVLVYDCC